MILTLTLLKITRYRVHYPDKQRSTFVYESQGHCSVADYFTFDIVDDILDCCVLNPDIILSDHLPIAIRYNGVCPVALLAAGVTKETKVKQLRWDHADLLSCYNTRPTMSFVLMNC